jgi:hypothetical protein
LQYRVETREPQRRTSGSATPRKKMQLLGYLEAVSETAAIERAVSLFGLDDQKRMRLAVNLRRTAVDSA